MVVAGQSVGALRTSFQDARILNPLEIQVKTVAIPMRPLKNFSAMPDLVIRHTVQHRSV